MLIILAGVSINMLVGENGIINMAQRAKNETEKAKEEEEQALASAFERNYVTYNGQLHVDGAKLMNENNEEVLLRGLALNSPIHYKNVDINSMIKSAKQWGVNIIRVGIPTAEYLGEDKEESMKQLFEIVDACIHNDFYVILVFLNNDVINNRELAEEYFTTVANRYKNSPNLLYEINNEVPIDTTWEQVIEYANKIIPIIRAVNDNSIIMVGTLNVDTRPNEVIGKELNYDNIMYSVHFYPSNNAEAVDTVTIDSIHESILNNVPIFITEWSAGSSTGTKMNFEIALKLVKLMKDYGISWTNYCLGDGEHTFSILKKLTSNELLEETNLTILAGSVFYGCTSLNEVYLPDSLTEIGSYCFYNTNIELLSLSRNTTLLDNALTGVNTENIIYREVN